MIYNHTTKTNLLKCANCGKTLPVDVRWGYDVSETGGDDA